MNVRARLLVLLTLLPNLCLLSACQLDRVDSAQEAKQVSGTIVPDTLVAGANTVGEVRLRLVDEQGDGIGRSKIVLQERSGTALVAQPNATASDGTTLAQIRCARIGTAFVLAYLDEGFTSQLLGEIGPLNCTAPASAPAAAEPNAAAPLQDHAQMFLAALHSQAAADITAPMLLTLLVTDSAGKPIVGQVVTLSSDRATDAIVPNEAVTDAAGQVTISLTAQNLGTATVTAVAGSSSAQTTVEFVSGPPNMLQASLLARNSNVVADGRDVQLFDLTVRDAAGNLVPYALVNLTSDTSSDTFAADARLTDNLGHYLVQLSGTKAGLHTVSAATHTGAVPGTAILVAGPASAQTSMFTLQPAIGTADGVSPGYVALVLEDAFSNTIENQNVTLSSSVLTDVIDAPTAPTDETGTVVWPVVGTHAGAHTLTAQVQNLTLTAPWTLTAGPINTALSTLTLSPQNPNAGDQVTVTVGLQDVQGNPVTGQQVAFATSMPGGGFTPASAETDANGTATSALKTTKAGSHQVVASLGSAGTSLSGQVQVAPGEVAVALSTLAATPSQAVANGTAVVVLQAVAQDAFGNLVPNAPVKFLAPGAQITIASASGASDSAGQWSASAVSTAAGTKTIFADVGSVTLGPVNVQFIDGPASAVASSWIATRSPSVANNQNTVQLDLIMRDAFGNVIANQAVRLDSAGTLITLQPASGNTDATGHFRSYARSTVSQTTQVRAQSAQVQQLVSVQFIAGPPVAATSTLTCLPSSLVADQNSTGVIQLVARDAFGNTVSGSQAQFSVTGVGGQLSQQACTTDALGFASTQLTGASAGASVVSAVLDGNAALTTPVTFVAGPADSNRSRLILAPLVQQVGGTPITATLQLRDAQNNPSVGAAVSVTALNARDASRVAVLPTSAVTKANGEAVFSVTSTQAQSLTLMAQGGQASVTAVGQFTAGTPDAGRSTLAVSAGSPVANGVATLTVTAALQDVFGNPVSQVPTALVSSVAADSIAAAAPVTDANGIYRATVAATLAGTRTLTVQAGAVSLHASAVFGAGAPDGNQSVLTLSPNAVVANGAAQAAVGLLLRDAFANTIASAPITIQVNDSNVSLGASVITTDSVGAASTTAQGTRAGSYSVSAQSGTMVLRQTLSLLPGSPAQSNSSWSIGSSQPADGNSAVSVILHLRDAYSNAVPQALVTLASGAPATISSATSYTDAQGNLAAAVVSTQSGPASITAQVGPSVVPASVAFYAGSPNAARSTLVVTPNPMVAQGAVGNVWLTLVDAFGNLVTATPVTLSSTDSNDVLTGAAATDARGELTATLQSTTAGIKVISAAAALGAAVQGNVVVLPANTKTATVTLVANPNVLAADGASASVLRVQANDGNGLPLAAGKAVLALAAPSTATLAATSLTLDANGQATTLLRSSSVANQIVTATVSSTTVSTLVRAIAANPNGALSQLTLTPLSTTADGQSAVLISVLLQDALGHPVSNTAVALTADASVVLTASTPVTNSSGLYRATASSVVAKSSNLSAVSSGLTLSGTLNFAPGPANGRYSAVAVSPNALVADGVQTATVQVYAADQHTNGAALRPIALSSSQNHLLFAAPNGTTDANGIYVTTATSTYAGSVAVVAAVDAATWSTTSTWLPGPASATTSALVADPNTLTADGNALTTLHLTLQDSYGNALSQMPVNFACIAQGASLSTASATTDAAGAAQTQLRSTISGPVRINATAAGVTVSAQATFKAGVPSSNTSTMTVFPDTLPADGVTAAAVTVVVRDVFGNLVPGQTVLPVPPSPSITLTGPSSSDANGVWQGAVVGSVAQSAVIVVAANTASVNGDIRFTASALNAAASSVTSGPGATLANGVSTANITVHTTDASGNAVGSVPVVLAVDDPNTTLQAFSGTTDQAGIWQTGATSSAAGQKTLIATLAGQSVQGEVTFVAGLATSSQSTLTASPNLLVADGVDQASITVALRDSLGNLVANQAISMTALPEGYALGANGGISDDLGLWNTTLSATSAGEVILTAVVGGASMTNTVTFVAGAPDANNSRLWASAPSFVADNTSQITLVLNLADIFGNPVPGAGVTFRSDFAQDHITPAQGSTTDDGVLIANMTSAAVGTRTIVAATSGNTLLLAVDVVSVSGPPDGNASLLVVSPTTVTADGISRATVQLTVADALSHPVAGQAVRLWASGQNNIWDRTTGATDGNGLFVGSLTSAVAEYKLITADAGTASLKSSVIFAAGTLDSNSSCLLASPSPALADGQSKVSLILLAKDGAGNPAGAHAVALSSSGSGQTLTPASGTTAADGTFAATMTSSVAESKTIAARMDGTSVTTRVNYVSSAPSEQVTLFTASPTSQTADNSPIAVTLTATDSAGNPLVSVPVLFGVIGSTNSLTPANTTTDSSGSAATVLSSTLAQTKVVTAQVGSTKVATVVRMTAGPPIAAMSSLIANANTVAADGRQVAELVLRLRDAYGNATPNVAVAWSTTGSHTRLTKTAGTTAAAGVVSNTLSSTEAIEATVTAQFALTSLALPVTFVPAEPSNTVSVLTASPNTVAADGTSVTTVVLLARDAQGNGASGLPVQFTSEASSELVYTPQASVTDAWGRISATLSSTHAGNQLISVALPNTTVILPVQFVAGPPSNVTSSLVISPSAVVADGMSAAAVQVSVKDAFSNVLADYAVEMSVSGSGAVFDRPSGVTGRNGQFEAALTSTVAQTKTVAASLGSTSLSSTVTFEPGVASPTGSTFVPNPAQAVADGNSPITLTLLLADAFGNRLGAVPVTFSSTQSGTAFEAANASTDANGQLAVVVTSTHASRQSVTASAQQTAIDAQVTFVAGASTNQSISLVAQPSYVAADSPNAVVVTLFVSDALGNPVSGQVAAFVSSMPQDLFVYPQGSATASDGTLAVSLTARQAGARTITASFAGLATSDTVGVYAGQPNAAISSVVISPNTVIADGNSLATMVLTVRDAYGNLVPNTGVTASLAAGSATTLIAPAFNYTGLAGTFSAALTSTVTGPDTVQLYFGASSLQATATFVPGSVSALTSSLTTVPPSLQVDGSTPAQLTLVLLDAFNNVVPNRAVTLSASGGNNTLSPSSGTTNAQGIFRASLTSTTAETKALIATASTTSISGAVTFTAGSPSGVHSTLAAAPALLVADGRTVSNLTATARDAWGNVVANANTVFLGGSADVFTPPMVATDSTGKAVTQAVSTQARAATLSAKWGATSVTTAVTWTSGSPNAVMSYVSFNPNQPAADNVIQSTVNVVVNDAFGNPVANQNVVLSLTGSNTLTATSGKTGTTGIFSTLVKSTQAGTKTLTATAGGIPLMGNITFVAGSPNAATSVLTISPNVVFADNQNAVTLSALIKDRYSNLVLGQACNFAASSNSVVFTPTTAVTNASGLCSVLATSPLVQTSTLTITAATLSTSNSVTFAPGPADANTSTFTASPNQGLAINGNGVASLSITVRDAQQRVMPATGVIFSQTNPQGFLAPIKVTTTSLGSAASSLTSAVAGTLIVSARVGPALLHATTNFIPQAPVCSNDILLGGRPVVLLATTPVQVATRDMNGDGKADVVVLGSATTAAVNVFLGDGNGHFSLASSKSIPGSPLSMILVDINKDSVPDVVAVNGTQTLYSFINNTTTSLGNAVAIAANGNIGGLCWGDLNNDGNNDIVALSKQNPSGFSVLMGIGNGNFLSPSFYSSSGAPVHCVVADFDNDGNPDVAITNSSNATVDLWRGSGNGVVTSWKSLAVGAQTQNPNFSINTNDIRAADLNKDGIMDLVVSNTSNLATQVFDPNVTSAPHPENASTVSVLMGTSSGNFNNQVLYHMDTYAAGLQIRDMDNDGNLDIVVACGTQTTRFELYANAPSFAANTIGILRGDGNGNFVATTPIHVGVSPTSVAVADFDQDGSLDIAYNSWTSNGAGVQFGNNGNFTSAPQYVGGSYMRTWILASDINLDGRMDFLGGFINDAMEVAVAKADGTYSVTTTNMPGAQEAVMGDFNGDGLPDVASFTYYNNTPLIVGLGSGDGNFSVATVSWNPQVANQRVQGIAVGDLNGDGLDDIAIVIPSYSAAFIFTATGDANVFASSSFVQPSSQGTCTAAIISDFSNQGISDLALLCQNLLVYVNSGGGVLSAPTVVSQLGTSARLLAGRKVDANGDGYPDIVTVSNKEINIFINNQSSHFTAINPITLPFAATAIVGGDFDGDGYPDLVIPANPGFILLKGSGSGTYGAPKSYMGGVVTNVIITDVNGDSRPDLVAATLDNGMVIYESQGCL